MADQLPVKIKFHRRHAKTAASKNRMFAGGKLREPLAKTFLEQNEKWKSGSRSALETMTMTLGSNTGLDLVAELRQGPGARHAWVPSPCPSLLASPSPCPSSMSADRSKPEGRRTEVGSPSMGIDALGVSAEQSRRRRIHLRTGWLPMDPLPNGVNASGSASERGRRCWVHL